MTYLRSKKGGDHSRYKKERATGERPKLSKTHDLEETWDHNIPTTLLVRAGGSKKRTMRSKRKGNRLYTPSSQKEQHKKNHEEKRVDAKKNGGKNRKDGGRSTGLGF